MEYTFLSLSLINIPLILAEFLCFLMLTSALTGKRPEKKRTMLLFIPYGLILILPGSVFYLWGLFDSMLIQLLNIYLEVAAWMLVVKAAYRETWRNAPVTASAVNSLYWLLSDLEGFILAGNYDLSIPGELAAYIGVNCLGILLLDGIAAWFIVKKHLYEEYMNFISNERENRFWRIIFFLLPAVRIIAVELVNERIMLNNSNPVIALLLLLIVYGVMNYIFRCDMQKKQIQEQQVSLRQQELYIQNLESVQRDVRIFRHDFKNRMAGAALQADEGDFQAVQEFISEVTGEFERKVGEKIFQTTQLGNIRLTELKGLLAVKAADMQRREIPFRLEAAAPVTKIDLPAGELCRAVGILLDNAAEETESFLREREIPGKKADNGKDAVEGTQNKTEPENRSGAGVTALFCADGTGVDILVRNPVRDQVPLSRIWKEGYSTKGSGRGMGLTSLRRIVESYDHVSSRTYQEDGFFVQELRIGAKGG